MRILLATDGSESADVAVGLVTAMPLNRGSRVRVVRVVEPMPASVMTAWELVAPLDGVADERALTEDARAGVESTAAKFRAHGVDAECAVLRGRPAAAIVADAEGHLPDLVVVGSRGHSRLDRMLLGSVSAEVVDHSPVPVLVARRPGIRRVLIGVDGSDIASEAVEAVVRWPILADAEIKVISVVPEATWWPSRFGAEPLPAAAESLRVARNAEIECHRSFAEEAAARLRRAGLGSTTDVRLGTPADEIVAASTAWGADLVIVGSHGRTGLSRWLLGSVARNVLHHAVCSVLVVRRHAAPRPVVEVRGAVAFGAGSVLT
jgi:nucleotide-binding universal stress UspA family protein